GTPSSRRSPVPFWAAYAARCSNAPSPTGNRSTPRSGGESRRRFATAAPGSRPQAWARPERATAGGETAPPGYVFVWSGGTPCGRPVAPGFFRDTRALAHAVTAHGDRAQRIAAQQPVDADAHLGREPRDVEQRDEVIGRRRSEEHTSELQSRENLVCRLLLEK